VSITLQTPPFGADHYQFCHLVYSNITVLINDEAESTTQVITYALYYKHMRDTERTQRILERSYCLHHQVTLFISLLRQTVTILMAVFRVKTQVSQFSIGCILHSFIAETICYQNSMTKITDDQYLCFCLWQCSRHVQNPLDEHISLLSCQAPGQYTQHIKHTHI